MREANNNFFVVLKCFSCLVEKLWVAICAVLKPGVRFWICHLENFVLLIAILSGVHNIDIIRKKGAVLLYVFSLECILLQNIYSCIVNLLGVWVFIVNIWIHRNLTQLLTNCDSVAYFFRSCLSIKTFINPSSSLETSCVGTAEKRYFGVIHAQFH